MKHNLLHGMIIVLLFGVPSAMSHHAFSPVYDQDQTISAEGVVTEFRFVNPHAMMTLESQDEDGNQVTWTVEFAGKLNLVVVGWTEETIKAGERVTVYGNPTHTGSPRMFFSRIVRADGTELLNGGVERRNTIEELRRQRRQQRTPQN